MFMKVFLPVFGALLLGLCQYSFANDDEGLSEQIRQLKNQALNLNRYLTLLERELLYASPQTSIFVSVDVGGQPYGSTLKMCSGFVSFGVAACRRDDRVTQRAGDLCADCAFAVSVQDLCVGGGCGEARFKFAKKAG